MVDASRAVRLRRSQSPPEGVIWSKLRADRLGGLKFRRQHAIGPYVVDFYCHAARLVIELDGASHAKRRNHDAARDRWMQRQGYRVLRFRASAVSENIGEGLRRIRCAALEQIREQERR